MAIAEVSARFIADTSGLTAALASVDKRLKTTASKMQSVGKTMGTALGAAGLAVSAGLGAAVKVSMDFEAQMDRVAAISGATGMDLDRLRETALKLGADTSKSATEVAQGMEIMAAAGYDANEVIAAMPGVIAAAEASGEDLATVIDVVSSALNGFKLEATEATHVADVMAMAANKSRADVRYMGEAFKYAAPQAQALGVSLEELSAATMIMADAGLEGSQAGTTLRMAFQRMASPTAKAQKLMKQLGITFFDANGQMKPMGVIIGELHEKFKGLTDQQKQQALTTLFGTEASTGMLNVIEAGPKVFDEYTKALENSDGAAKEAAKTMMDNLKGAIEEMMGSIETAAISIGNALTPAIRKASEWVKKFADWFNGLSDSMKQKIAITAAVVAVLLLLGSAVGFVVAGIGALLPVLATLSGTFGLVAGAIVAATGVVTYLVANWDDLSKKGLNLTKVLAGISPVLTLVAGGIKLVKEMTSDAIAETDLFGDKVSEETKKALGAYFDLDKGVKATLKELQWSGDAVTKETAKKITQNFSQMADQIVSGLQTKKKEANEVLGQWFTAEAVLPKDREEEILKRINEHYDNEIKSVEEGEKRIKEIMKKASQEKRELTEEELAEIENIRLKYRSQAMENLTKNEMEQVVIYENMAAQREAISAREAATIVQNSIKARDQVIKDAAKVRDEKVAWAIKARDELGVISDEEAQKLIDNANKEYEQTVKKAEERHIKVVDEAKAQAKEHVREVDWETGEIKSKWEVMWDDVVAGFETAGKLLEYRWELIKTIAKTKAQQIKDNVTNTFQSLVDKAVQKYEDMKTRVTKKLEDLRSKAKQKAIDIRDGIINAISSLPDKAYSWGRNLVTMFVKGLKSRFGWVIDAAYSIARIVERYLEFHSPTEEGPASDSDKWAPNFMKMFARGLEQNIPLVSRAVNLAANEMAALNSLSANPTISPNYVSATRAGIVDQDATPAGTLLITGNNFYVRNEADIDAIAEKLFQKQQRYLRARGRVR